MSFFKHSVSISRFYVEDFSTSIFENFEEKLRQYAFISIDDNAEELSMGWASFENIFDTTFENFSPRKGQYFCFSFRLDVRKIYSTTVKKYCLEAEKAELEKLKEHNKKYLSKERKAEIKEQVLLKLRTQALPVPKAFHVVWNSQSNSIYFATTNKTIINLFSTYFEKTFKCKLTQIEPEILALREENISLVEKESIAKLTSTSFEIDSQETYTSNTNKVLGEEFLTWLWYKSETDENFASETNNLFSVSFENSLLVRGEKTSTAVNGKYNLMQEARLGLSIGKKVSKAFIVFYNLDEEFKTTVNAENFFFNSFTRPSIQRDVLSLNTKEEVEEEMFFLSMNLFETGFNRFDEMYKVFLKVRLKPLVWQEEVQKIKNWISHSIN